MNIKGFLAIFFMLPAVLLMSHPHFSVQEKQDNQGYQYPEDNTPCSVVDMEQIEVPDDFYIAYTSGPTHAEWGADRSISVSADGSYEVRESRWSIEEKRRVTKVISQGKITLEAVKKIFSSVVSCRFFDLEKSYWNTDFNDGRRELMQVVASEKRHSVVTYYYNVRRFDSIKFTLMAEIPNSSQNDGYFSLLP